MQGFKYFLVTTYYALQEIPGSSVVGALASFLHQPGVWTLPHFYVKAGSILLVQMHHLYFAIVLCPSC